MRKSDKNIENKLRLAFTDVCESALKDVEGFHWLTHLVNYSNFPNSLKVICVFETNQHLDNYLLCNNNNHIQSLIQCELNKLDIKLKNVTNHVLFDTEENCEKQHQGNWAKRLK